MLEINGSMQISGIGTFCWKSLCADMVGLPTALDPLIAESTPFIGHFHLTVDEPPDSLYLGVMAVTPADEVLGLVDDWRIWHPPHDYAVGVHLLPRRDAEYEFRQGPGLYLVLLAADWDYWGSASFGFLVQVGDSGPDGSPAPPGTPEEAVAPSGIPTHAPLTRIGKGRVTALAASLDGQRLAIATPLGVYLYSTDARSETWHRQFEREPVSLAFSPDSSRLIVGLADAVLPVVDVRSGKTALELAGQEDIHGVWSPDGEKILTSGDCEQVLVWDARTGQILHEVQPARCSNVTTGLVNAAWSWDGGLVFVTYVTGRVMAWDAHTYLPLAGYEPHPPESTWSLSLAASPDRDLFAINSGYEVAIMDGRTGEMVRALEADYVPHQLEHLLWSPGGERLLADDFLWEVDSGRLIDQFDNFIGLAWMPDGDTVFGKSADNGSLIALSVSSGERLFSLAGFGRMNVENGTPLFWNDGSLLTFDGVEEIRWDPRTGAILGQQATNEPAWLSETWRPRSPDGTRLATGTLVTDAATGAELVHLVDGADSQRDVVAWSPDGTRLVSSHSLQLASTVVWEAGSGQVTLRLQLEAAGSPLIQTLAWSPDGSWIAAGGALMDPASGLDDGMIVLWDARSGAQAGLLTAGMASERIQSMAWSPDGRWLAAGMYGGRIVVWDMLHFAPSASLEGHADMVMALSWSADGALLASSSVDGTVLIWELP